MAKLTVAATTSVSIFSASVTRHFLDKRRGKSLVETSLEAMVVLHKSLVEKQWKLQLDFDRLDPIKVKSFVKEDEIISSGTNVRQRRIGTSKKVSESKKKREGGTVYDKPGDTTHTYEGGLLEEGSFQSRIAES